MYNNIIIMEVVIVLASIARCLIDTHDTELLNNAPQDRVAVAAVVQY